MAQMQWETAGADAQVEMAVGELRDMGFELVRGPDACGSIWAPMGFDWLNDRTGAGRAVDFLCEHGWVYAGRAEA